MDSSVIQIEKSAYQPSPKRCSDFSIITLACARFAQARAALEGDPLLPREPRSRP